MKNKLLCLGIFVLMFATIIIGVPSKALAAAPTISDISPAFGIVSGGTAVTITGTNFEADSVITIGGAPVTDFSLVGPTSITAVTPAGTAGAKDVVITNSTLNPGTDTLAGGFTYVAAPTAVNLLTTADFAVFSNTGISSTGTTSIAGDIAVGPGVTSTAITGNFALTAPPTTYTTSALVTGKVYAYDYDVPTPTKVNQASLDLTTAYNAALVPATTVLDAGSCIAGTCDLAGTTLAPGVYTFDVAHVTISNSMHLSGGASAVWIFQIPGTLNISSAKSILLSGGAVPANIFWAVAGTTTLQTTSTFEGNILSGPGTSTIAMQNGATLHGRALGQKDVTLIANTIVSPTAPAASSDATLSRIDITPSAGTISPLIAPSVHNSISVPNTVTNTTVTPTASDAHTTITVNNVPVVSGVASASIPLNVGVNTITITTTAQDTTTLSYVILMYRAGLVGTSGGHSSSSVTSTNPTSGCSVGNLFSATTGQACNTNLIPGCSVGNLFSATTGQSCGVTISSATSEIQKVIQNLKFGMTSQDVRTLQLFLISQNKGPASLSLKNHGTTIYFGKLTVASLMEWQKVNELVVDGVFGSKTKEKIKLLNL